MMNAIRKMEHIVETQCIAYLQPPNNEYVDPADVDLAYADLQLQSASFRQGFCNSGINQSPNFLYLIR
jgi:hypothetical protein